MDHKSTFMADQISSLLLVSCYFSMVKCSVAWVSSKQSFKRVLRDLINTRISYIHDLFGVQKLPSSQTDWKVSHNAYKKELL